MAWRKLGGRLARRCLGGLARRLGLGMGPSWLELGLGLLRLGLGRLGLGLVPELVWPQRVHQQCFLLPFWIS